MEDASTVKIVKIIYVLYLVGFIFPICSIIGVVFAYVYRDDAREYLKTHIQYQIRGFWIYLLYYSIVCLLFLLVIGWLLLPLTLLWWIIRAVIGLKQISKERPITNPKTWLF